MDTNKIMQDLSLGNPFIDIFTALRGAKGNKPPKDPFTGKDIYNPLDSNVDKSWKSFTFLYNKFMPSMLQFSDGSGGALNMTAKSMTGEKDKYGKVISPEQALGRWFGVNILAPTPQQAIKEERHKRRELKMFLNKILKDSNVSIEEKKKTKKQYKQGLLELYGKN